MLREKRCANQSVAVSLLLACLLETATLAAAEWQSLGDQASRVLKNGNPKEAAQIYRDAVKRARHSNADAAVVADLLLNLCECQIQAGNTDEAAVSLQAARKVAGSLIDGNEALQIRMLRRETALNDARERWDEAVKTQTQLVKLVISVFGETSRYASVELNNLSRYQFATGNFKGEVQSKAREYKALLAQGADPTSRIMITKALSISSRMVEAKMLDEAQAQLMKAFVDAGKNSFFDLQMLASSDLFRIAMLKHDEPNQRKWRGELLRLYAHPQGDAVSALNRVQSLVQVVCAYKEAESFNDDCLSFAERALQEVERARPMLVKQQYFAWKAQATYYLVLSLTKRGDLQRAAKLSKWQLPSRTFDNGWDFLLFDFTCSMLANEFSKKGDFKGALEQLDRLIDAYERNPFANGRRDHIEKWRNIRADCVRRSKAKQQ